MIQDDISPAIQMYWPQRRSVQGHMYDIDMLLFDRILSDQAGEVQGDLLEIGAYLGKSAIVIGVHQQPNERVWICDVFDDAAGDSAQNVKENESSYVGLTRTRFEANYSRYVAKPPTVLQKLSSEIREDIPSRSIRFAHIDGGHLHSTVVADLDHAMDYLLPDRSVVVLDDLRSVHTPGVAAAAWQAVADGRLFPICTTEIKGYFSPSEVCADRWVVKLGGWLDRHPEVRHGTQAIHGRRVLLALNPWLPTWRTRVRSLVPLAVLNRVKPVSSPYLGD